MNRHGNRRPDLTGGLRVLLLLSVAIGTVGFAKVRAGDVFTPDHVAKVRGVVSAEISPDGEHIAYLLAVPRKPYEDENGSPWIEWPDTA